MKQSLTRIILIIIALQYYSPAWPQCPGGVHWVNGPNTGGNLRDTGAVLVNDTVYVRSTTPTFGSFSAGRPGYITNSTTWNGYNFEAIGLFRGGGSGATTRFVFKTPLDSNHIHFRISDVRGDGFNTEHQTIRGYRNGVLIPATFKDPVNGVVIVSGNEVRGASTTSSLVQSATRIFFNQAVDSVIISSIAFSDFVILDLFARCDIVLAPARIPLQVTKSGNGAMLVWSSPAIEKGTLNIQRSQSGTDWKEIASLSQNQYHYTDVNPLPGLNYYRIKFTDNNNRLLYSTVAIVDFRNRTNLNLFRIYPNPFNNQLNISVDKSSCVKLFNSNGKEVIAKAISSSLSGDFTMTTSNLPNGIYFVLITSKDGTIIKKSILKLSY